MIEKEWKKRVTCAIECHAQNAGDRTHSLVWVLLGVKSNHEFVNNNREGLKENSNAGLAKRLDSNPTIVSHTGRITRREHVHRSAEGCSGSSHAKRARAQDYVRGSDLPNGEASMLDDYHDRTRRRAFRGPARRERRKKED